MYSFFPGFCYIGLMRARKWAKMVTLEIWLYYAGGAALTL